VTTIKVFNHYLRMPFVLLAIAEAVAFYLSVYISIYLRLGSEVLLDSSLVPELNDVGLFSAVYTFVMMVAMLALGHYQSEQHVSDNHLPGNILRCSAAMSLGVLALLVLIYMFPPIYMGRGITAIAIMTSFILVVLVREIFFHTIDSDYLKRNLLIYGAGKKAATLINEKGGVKDGVSYKVVGYIPIEGEEVSVPKEKLVHLDGLELSSYAKENNVDEIVLALEDRRKQFPTDGLLACKMAGINVINPPTFLEREQGKLNIEMLSSSWLIFTPGFTRNGFKIILARLFDVISSLTILILALPVLLLTAFIIAAESGFRHPIFYKQTRVGLDGVTFELLKFRSMKVDAEKDGKAVWAKKDDDRITMIGKFIRKVRIDELPQIINILKGDMRLVGPRPERPEFVEDLSEKIPYYKQRHSVKPGLAGWAQLRYPYGATERDAYEKLQYDLYYVKNYNVVMDLFILIQTVEIVVLGKGAR